MDTLYEESVLLIVRIPHLLLPILQEQTQKQHRVDGHDGEELHGVKIAQGTLTRSPGGPFWPLGPRPPESP